MVPSSLSDGLRETLSVFDRTAPGTPLTTTEVAERLDVGRRSTYSRLERLEAHDLVTTKKVGARGRVWWRPPTVESARGAGRSVPPTEVGRVFDRIDDAFWALDDEFRFTYINDRAEELLQRSSAELVGENVWEVLPWLEGSNAREELEAAMAAGSPGHYEDYLEPNGRWYDVRVYPAESGLSVYYRDVTDRKERERRLAESERRNRTLVDNFPNGVIALFDRDLRHSLVGGSLFEVIDLTVDEVEGKTVREIFPEHIADQLEPSFHAVFEGESGEVVVEAGEKVRQFRTFPVRDEDGEVVAGLGMSQDVTERRERERELERYETIVETVDDGVYAVDEDSTFVLVNDALCSMVGYDREELIGSPASTIADESAPPRAERLASQLEAGERDLATLELDLQTRSGETVPVETRFARYPISDGHGRCGVVRDVTERLERERELQRYAGIVDAVGEPVYELDEEGRFTFVNDAMVERSGYSEPELLGEHVSIGIDDEDVARVESHMLEFLADGGGRTTVEFDVVTKEGERVPAENRIYLRTDDAGRFTGSAGMLWDVTDRVERERRLQESEQRYRTLVDNFPNGAVALYDEGYHYAAVGGQMYDRIDISPADAVGMTVGERLSGEIVETLEAMIERAFEGESEEAEAPYDDRVFWLQSLPIRDDDGDVILAMVVTQDVTERKQAEEALERQRERLTALNELNEVVGGITDAAIDQSTREEIERIVCERLADSDSYLFAWIGDVDGLTGTVNLRVEAGVEGYLDDATITVDPDDERSRGPTGRALLEREIQVSRDVENDPGHDPYRDEIRRYGYRSSVAIPILYDDTLFGALHIYTERPDAFDDDERAVIGRLGEVVGHAIAAVERKRALMGDEVVEVEFKAPDVFDALDVPVELDGAIELEQAVPIGEGSYLVYGSATGDGLEAAHALVESESLGHWSDVNVLAAEADGHRIEIRMDDPPITTTVAAHGGYVHESSFSGRDFYMRIHLAPSADVREVSSAIEEVYPTVTMVTRRQVSRSRPEAEGRGASPVEELTDRQRAAIRTAFHAGFFEWPRDSSGQDVADALGIDPSTFHHHLREAQRKIIERVLAPEAAA